MESSKLTKFLKALDTVKHDLTCGVCLDLCKHPVILSKCCHIICQEHFESLNACPNCDISLEGCNIFTDDKLEKSITAARELDSMFDHFREKDSATDPDETSNVENIGKRTRQKHLETKTNRQIKEKEVSKTPKPRSGRSNTTTTDTKDETVLSVNSTLNKTLEKRNNKGETILHIACRLGKIEKVEECLKEGANTNTKDNAGWTPLHEVVQNGRLDLVQLLLQYNTLIDVPGQCNETPLHEAVRYNHINIAKELVQNGADINARNCKGETPLQLAQGKMKEVLKMASENILQTQSINISHISKLYLELDLEEMRIYCVSSSRTVHSKLKTLVKHHNNLYLETKFSKRVTHLVVDAVDGVCQSSLEILQAIVNHMWLVTTDWITLSSNDKLEKFETYEVKGVGTTSNNGPMNSRYNKYKQQPGIFDGCHIYLHNFNTPYEISKTITVTKTILTKLITDAGGVVLRRVPNPESIPESERLVPYHAKKNGKLFICSHYIIFKDMYEPMYNMKHLKALPIGWLVECLEKYELCEPW